MQMELGTEWAVDWMRRSAKEFTDHRVALGTLDREIGDGDHGENMHRGFAEVALSLDADSHYESVADLLRSVATTLISSVGGAAGPLYGTAFLKASDAVAGEAALDSNSVVALLRAARDGIILRGGAQPGDKTMVDAWSPAVEAAERSLDAGEDPQQILDSAAAAASAGAAATEPLIARKGRASYLGERAIGHRDPGAESSALLLQAAADAAEAVPHG
jgi:phosphoenolpyruvate---glycerone phosphotransferase subunit DhaL